MSAAKATPGPWSIEPCTLETALGEPFCGQYLVSGLSCSDGRFDEADAKLIAASPDLADALEAALLFHRGGPWTDDDAQRWRLLTGHSDATTKALCDCIRARLRAAGRIP